MTVLEALDAQMSSYNLDEFLTPDTQLLCESILFEAHRPISYSFEGHHREVYIFLRTGLMEYSTIITTLATPVGAEHWIAKYGSGDGINKSNVDCLEETVGKEWDLAKRKGKFDCEGEIEEFKEDCILENDDMSSDGMEESDDDGIVLNILL